MSKKGKERKSKAPVEKRVSEPPSPAAAETPVAVAEAPAAAAPMEGWNPARPVHIPRGTPWPAALALGIMFFAWGLVTSPVVVGIGLVVFAVSLFGWVGEIRHEQ